MPQGNETLFVEVLHSLQHLKNHLNNNALTHYDIHFEKILKTIYAAQQVYRQGRGLDKSAIIKTILVITSQIHIETAGRAENLQAGVLEFKLYIKKELENIILKILTAEVKVKNADFSDIIKMLAP